MTTADAVKEVKKLLSRFDSSAVAYSGGVDSALVLALACRAVGPETVTAVTVSSVLAPLGEDVGVLPETLGAGHVVIEDDPLAVCEIRRNGEDRCYHCKSRVFDLISAVSRAGACILDGTTKDDLLEYRPGLKAARERGVISPLLRMGLSKRDVRELAEELCLPQSEAPSSPCLATRVPYGDALDARMLERIGRSEKYLKSFCSGSFRVRSHGGLARIEAREEDIPILLSRRGDIAVTLREFGFEFVALDLEGFRSGCFDRGIKI